MSGVLADESRAYDEGILEDLKRQRDVLVAMKDTFDRRDRLAGDNVVSLEKRITNTEVKIQTIRSKPDAQSQVDKITKHEEQIKKVWLFSSFVWFCIFGGMADCRIVRRLNNC